MEDLEKPVKHPNYGGAREGGGRKSMAKQLNQLTKEARTKELNILKAEFWVQLANDVAIPRLRRIMENEDDSVAWKGVKEVLDRSHGRPRESIDLTTGGEKLEGMVINIELDEIRQKYEAELRGKLLRGENS